MQLWGLSHAFHGLTFALLFLIHHVHSTRHSPVESSVRCADHIFTYFVNGSMHGQDTLIKMWKRNWESNGWRTAVLTEADARRHPLFAEYDRIFSGPKMRTTNPPFYERACFLR